MDTTAIIAIAGGLTGFTTAGIGLYMARSNRRKVETDSDSTVVSTAVDMAERLTATAGSLIGPLQQQLQEAQKTVADMRERLATLEAKADQASKEYQDCREREARAIEYERSLKKEVDALRTFVKARRDTDLFPEPGAQPPEEREVWSEERRAAYRLQQKAFSDLQRDLERKRAAQEEADL